ncbi:hypothetical protein Tco_1087512 [Tanacetum coccineum]
MKNIRISDVADYSSSFSYLPDEIILQILIDTILFTSFTDHALDPPVVSSLRSYWPAISCLKKFARVKSLCIQHPSSFDTDSLFKWKIKFGNRLILCSSGRLKEDEDWEFENKKLDILEQCLKDLLTRINLSLPVVKFLPLLEKITTEDSGKRGKVFLSGEKVVEMRNSLLRSPFEIVKQQLHNLNILCMTCQCYVPLLELPVSGDNDGSEDEEEAAYSEFVMEICKNRRGRLLLICVKLVLFEDFQVMLLRFLTIWLSFTRLSSEDTRVSNGPME